MLGWLSSIHRLSWRCKGWENASNLYHLATAETHTCTHTSTPNKHTYIHYLHNSDCQTPSLLVIQQYYYNQLLFAPHLARTINHLPFICLTYEVMSYWNHSTNTSFLAATYTHKPVSHSCDVDSRSGQSMFHSYGLGPVGMCTHTGWAWERVWQERVVECGWYERHTNEG